MIIGGADYQSGSAKSDWRQCLHTDLGETWMWPQARQALQVSSQKSINYGYHIIMRGIAEIRSARPLLEQPYDV
jgi:hypothetical protein